MNEEVRNQVMQVCEVLYNKKAQDIKAIYVEDKTIIASWFVICSGTSVTQVKTLSDELEEKSSGIGLQLKRTEGYTQGRWIVQDYGYVLVHIFIPEERQYYNMERLWLDDDPEKCINYNEIAEKEQ